MKIALPWNSREERQQKADEYIITFVNKPNNFDNLMEFLSVHLDDKFNIIIDTSEYSFDYARLKVLNAIHHNLYFVIPPREEIYTKLKEYNIKYYFGPECAATNYRSLEQLVNLGVCAVYIADDLCYDLKQVRRACDHFGVELRWILNAIPSFLSTKGTDVRSPIMLPECVDELSKYVDTYEFSENHSWARLDVLYKIWFKNKKWRENLKAIYPELEIDIWNQAMIPNYNIYKMNCRYRCAYGSACKKCNQFKEMADDLYKKNIEYVLPTEEKGEE